MAGIRKIISIIFVLTVFVGMSNSVSASFVEAESVRDVRWRTRVVKLSISNSFFTENSSIKVGSDVRGALARSIASWEKAANVRFETFDSVKQNVSPAGNAGDGISLLTIAGSAENILLFGKNDNGLPAATRVFFDRKENITESDIVLNSTEQFSTDGTFGTFDLESVLVHEIGHLLGLSHISLSGTTMFESVPRNGLYALSSFRSRSLAEADIAAVREIYGKPADIEDCCGSILATITLPNGRPARQIDVFVESTDNGRLHGLGKTDNSGKVYFDSLPTGNYRIVGSRSKTEVPFQRLFSDSIDIEPNEQTLAAFTLPVRAAASGRILVGFNGQLSNVPVPLAAGTVSRVYVGVLDKFTEKLSIYSTSTDIKVVPDSFSEISQYEGLRVISFEVEIGAGAPDGEYSLVVGSGEFGLGYLPGVISIDRHTDSTIPQSQRFSD